MLDACPVMAFVATKEPVKARSFYEGTLGLRVIADEPFALVLDSNGTIVRVQKVQEVKPAPYTALGWQVTDIRGAVRRLGERGVTFVRFPPGSFLHQDELGVWTADDGTQVAWFKDPDGNTLSLTEFV